MSLKYRAFLSYAHKDSGWARWLHRKLESFSIDKDLRGKQTAMGPVPDSLKPIFRDREDFAGGHALTDATIEALDQSAALIVLCSAIAATRPVVDKEVELFRSRHPGRPVIPVIIDGSYPKNFPPALLRAFGPDGAITDIPQTILGPDLRDSGDGKSLGLAKIVAGLTGLGTDDVFRRAERHKRSMRRRIAAVAASIFLLLAAASTVAWIQRNRFQNFVSMPEEFRAFEVADVTRGWENPRALALETFDGTRRVVSRLPVLDPFRVLWFRQQSEGFRRRKERAS